MRVIINISEEDYKRVGLIAEMGLGTNIDEAIKYGVVLPKGCGRLIDADELLKEKRRFEDFDGDTFNIIHEETVINAETIIPADKER